MGQKGRGLGHVTYFKFWDPLYISGTANATNLQKLSVRKTRISGQSLHRGPGAEPIVIDGGKGGGGGGSMGFALRY